MSDVPASLPQLAHPWAWWHDDDNGVWQFGRMSPGPFGWCPIGFVRDAHVADERVIDDLRRMYPDLMSTPSPLAQEEPDQ